MPGFLFLLVGEEFEPMILFMLGQPFTTELLFSALRHFIVKFWNPYFIDVYVFYLFVVVLIEPKITQVRHTPNCFFRIHHFLCP